MDEFFDLTAPPRRDLSADATVVRDLHELDIAATAHVLASLNQQLPANRPVVFEGLWEVTDADVWQAPWSPIRLHDALQQLRMRPTLETFRSRQGAHWFRIQTTTNPAMRQPRRIGDVLAEARGLQREDLEMEARVLSELGDTDSPRLQHVIPRHQAAITLQLQRWESSSA